jgi:hypothetical protein
VNTYLEWLITFALPWLVGIIFLRQIHKTTPRIILVHFFLFESIALGMLALNREGINTPHGTIIGIISIFTAILITTSILGWNGLLYTISATIQEICMLTAVTLLAGRVPPGVIFLLIVPMYVLPHINEPRDWRDKAPLTAAWGIITIVLFLWIQEPLLNASIHAILGAWLIRKGIVHRQHNIYKHAKTTD